MKDKEQTVLDYHKKHCEVLGFWDSHTKTSVMSAVLNIYKTETIKNFFIDDMVINGDKVLIKWVKRHKPLSKKELKKEWNRDE